MGEILLSEQREADGGNTGSHAKDSCEIDRQKIQKEKLMKREEEKKKKKECGG